MRIVLITPQWRPYNTYVIGHDKARWFRLSGLRFRATVGSCLILLCVTAQQSSNALSLRGRPTSVRSPSVGPLVGPFVSQIPFSRKPSKEIRAILGIHDVSKLLFFFFFFLIFIFVFYRNNKVSMNALARGFWKCQYTCTCRKLLFEKYWATLHPSSTNAI